MSRMKDYEIHNNEILECEIYINEIPFVRYFHHNKIPTRYFVSKDGRVYSEISNRIMSPSLNPKGYYGLTLWLKKGKKQPIQIHKMVATVWCGGWHKGLVVDHVDGNHQNNHADNLEWVTQSENSLRAYRIGLHKKRFGEESPSAKYTESQVRQVCEMLEQNMPTKDISKQLNMSLSMVQQISSGKVWPHIVSQYNIPDSYRSPKSPISKELKREIRWMYATGSTLSEIVKTYPDISYSRIVHAVYDAKL